MLGLLAAQSMIACSLDDQILKPLNLRQAEHSASVSVEQNTSQASSENPTPRDASPVIPTPLPQAKAQLIAAISSPTTVDVNGSAAKGFLSNADVSVYSVSDGMRNQLLARTSTDATGAFQIKTLPADVGPVLIEISANANTRMLDESMGDIAAPTKLVLRAAVPDIAQTDAIHVNVLSEIAAASVERAHKLNANTITAANNAVASEFLNGASVITTKPLKVSEYDSNANPASRQLTKLLTAITVSAHNGDGIHPDGSSCSGAYAVKLICTLTGLASSLTFNDNGTALTMKPSGAQTIWSGVKRINQGVMLADGVSSADLSMRLPSSNESKIQLSGEGNSLATYPVTVQSQTPANPLPKPQGISAKPVEPQQISNGHYRIPTINNPFGVTFTPDGKHLIVAGTDGARHGRIAVYRYENNTLSLLKLVYLPDLAYGIATSNDGTLLAVAMSDSGIGLYKLENLLSGVGTSFIGVLATGSPTQSPSRGSATVHVGFSLDDTVLLASDEAQSRVAVFDINKVRNNAANQSLIGHIPAGINPIGFTFFKNADNHQLVSFTSSRASADSVNIPLGCGPSGNLAMGTVTVADLTVAQRDPPSSILNVVAAGCSPVRLVTDQSNKTYVSARSQNEIIVLDNKSLLSKTSQSPVVSNVPVGPAPVGIKLARNNTVLVVASSNRFDPNGYGQINLIDTRTNMLNTLPALKFPREIAVSPDGNTAVVTNYSSDSLEVIHLPTLGY